MSSGGTPRGGDGVSSSGGSGGQTLLESRQSLLPEMLRAALQSPLDEAGVAASVGERGVVTTGAGSSAAHARFLASVLDELGVPARFLPLSVFAHPRDEVARDRTLVVFSQGLSPNARIALQHADTWRAVWLVTAQGTASVGDHAAPGGDDAQRQAALEQATQRGVRLLQVPGANEYGTLLRILGPMTGYAAALRFAVATAGAKTRPAWADVPVEGICRAVAGAPARLDVVVSELDADALETNLALLASGRHTERIENLRLKVVEGMLRPAPPVWDLLEFAHGPFQQLYAGAATLLALTRADDIAEAEMLVRLQAMLDPRRHRLVRLASALAGPLAIFEHEAMMNALVLRHMRQRRIDASDWPGRDRDAPLYSYSGASGTPTGESAPLHTSAPPRDGMTTQAALRSRQLEDMTWPELARVLEGGGAAAILPLGSIEQHGLHLPFGTDAWIAAELGRRLAARLPEAIVLPVLPIGCAAEHLGFPGTLSLTDAALTQVLGDLTASVARHGFTRLFVFSAHGGNRDALAAALPGMRRVAGKLEVIVAAGLGATMEQMHLASAAHEVAPDASGHHAGEFETSIMLGIAPRSVRAESLEPGLAAGQADVDSIFYPDLRANAPSGTVGDPTGADGVRAQPYLEMWTDALVEIYRRGASRA